MKTSLQVRLSQHLALTPQLQQSIRLLQLSTLELQQELGQMIEANPFLEMEEDTAPAFERSLEQAQAPAEASAAATESEPDLGEVEFGTTEQSDWENGTEGDDFDGIRELPSSPGSPREDDEGGTDHESPDLSLAEHLQRQLAGMRLNAADRAAVQVLIDSLDDDGLLPDSLESIAASLVGWPEDAPLSAADADTQEVFDATLQLLRCALHWLQNLEPVGVGARSLVECLTLQLQAKTPNPERDLALEIVQHHLDLLAKRDTRRLMAATGCDEQDLRWAQALIRECEPKPGRAFTRNVGAAVVPDVLVLKSGRGFRVVLNPDVMPKLRINEVYAQALKRQGKGAAPLSSHLQEARWFLKNIQQRFDTILRVSTAIAERQKAFFTHGELAMKPLVLREIADELGLHESTISRVTTAKYMATPFGTYELKYFFGSGLATEAGGNASSTAVRALIKQFVAAEQPAKPLSDSQLADMLSEQGIQVARRTVAKYREALKIAPATLRKVL